LARNCVFWRNLEICSFRAKSNRTLIFLYPCLYFWSIFRKSGGFLKIWSFCQKTTKKQFWTLPVLVCFGAKFCFVDEILKFVVSGGFMQIWSVLQKIKKKTKFPDPSCTWVFWREILFFVWRNLEICSFRAKPNRTLIFPYPCLYFWNLFGKSGVFLPTTRKDTKFLDPS